MGYRERLAVGQAQDRAAKQFSLNYITKPGAIHQVYFGGMKGPTIFRIFPEMRNGVELPFRNSDGLNDFSEWIVAERMVRGAGALGRKFNALTRVKGVLDTSFGPLETFLSDLRRVLRTPGANPDIPQEWYNWVRQQNQGQQRQGFGDIVPAVSMCGFVQAAIFAVNNRYFMDEHRQWKPTMQGVVALMPTARESLEEIGNTENREYKGGDPKDYTNRYVLGPYISLTVGGLIQLNLVPPSGKSITHYEVQLTTNAFPVGAQAAAVYWQPWDDLFWFMTEEEQLKLLADNYPPEAVDYVFGSVKRYADKLPQGVHGKWSELTRKRVSASMGAGAQLPIPAGFQPQQQPTPIPSAALPQMPAQRPVQAAAPQAPATSPPGIVPGVALQPSGTTEEDGGDEPVAMDTVELQKQIHLNEARKTSAEQPIPPAGAAIDPFKPIVGSVLPGAATPPASADPSMADASLERARRQLADAQNAMKKPTGPVQPPPAQ